MSVQVIESYFHTSRKREYPHIIVLDEPDIGLSPAYAGALGDFIAEFAQDMPPTCDALVVVTHNRDLAKRIQRLNPGHLRMGDTLSFADWLAKPDKKRSVKQLLGLKDVAIKRFRAIAKMLDEAD